MTRPIIAEHDLSDGVWLLISNEVLRYIVFSLEENQPYKAPDTTYYKLSATREYPPTPKEMPTQGEWHASGDSDRIIFTIYGLSGLKGVISADRDSKKSGVFIVRRVSYSETLPLIHLRNPPTESILESINDFDHSRA